jgi:hypothetical protein
MWRLALEQRVEVAGEPSPVRQVPSRRIPLGRDRWAVGAGQLWAIAFAGG